MSFRGRRNSHKFFVEEIVSVPVGVNNTINGTFLDSTFCISSLDGTTEGRNWLATARLPLILSDLRPGQYLPGYCFATTRGD